MQYSAWLRVLEEALRGEAELVRAAALTIPKYGSSSQLNMIAVATVEVTTGAKTAVR